MKVDFSKDFEKSLDRLSGKIHNSVVEAINEVIKAESVKDITDCIKIQGLNSEYRIKIGNKRAFFVLYIELDGDLAMFEYLVSRGEAYAKKNMDNLRRKDN